MLSTFSNSFPSFPFSVITFTCSWLIEESNMTKKEHARVPWLSMFLRMSMPSFYDGSKF